MSLSPAFLDELRARTSLSALIGKTTKLQKAGREMRGCCPFHNEKTPSFYVNDDKGFYHCFGCSAHGDAIRWMTDQRGLPFIDAVKELAQAAGMEMPAQDRASAERAERAKGLHEAMADAATWFVEQLGGLGGGDARALLERRGLKPETARAFGIGFAPDSRGRLRTALKDFGDPMLVEAGLLIQVEGKEPYDRFRGRLMIPIRDARGRVIAFGGRVLDGGEPKYLNSPDTPLFDKGRTLYNLDRAAPAARKADRVLVVEGYMDVIALAQAGIAEAVAPLGTALTEAQLERLWRMADVPILCFDGDAAGQKAAARAAGRALPMLEPNKSLAFAVMPPGEDPDDVIRNGGARAFNGLVQHPTPLLHMLYATAKNRTDLTSPEGRAGLKTGLQVLASEIKNADVRGEYARAFNDVFWEEFGWKRGERNVIGRSIVRTGPYRARDIFRMFVRSVLYGLSRFPTVLAKEFESVATLKISHDGKHDDLLRWQDEMVEAIIRAPRLDNDAVLAICETRELAPATVETLQTDLRFQWHIDNEVAVRKLRAMIRLLHEEQEIDVRMAELNAQLLMDGGLDRYDEVEAERAILRQQRLLLYDMGYEVGEPEPPSDVG